MIGYLASILVTIAYLPQLYTTIKNKDAGDISLGLLLMLLLGMFLWALHAVGTGDMALLISSAVSFIQISIISCYKLFNPRKL